MRTIEDLLTVYAPASTHFPCIFGFQYFEIGSHCRIHATGAAIAKHPFNIKVPHRQLLMHLFCDRSLISVIRKETLMSAKIGL